MSNKELVDISKIKIDMSKSVDERMREYIDIVSDPYNIRVGDVGVHLSFEGDKSLKEVITSFLKEI